MTFQATVVRVMICSPGDVAAERDAVEGAIHKWNARRSGSKSGLIILPIRWENNAVPEMGFDGQEVINRTLVQDSDMIIAFFGTKLGAETARALSGTVEEIKTAADDGKTVRVYFSTAPIDRRQMEDVARLEKYRDSFNTPENAGLYGSFATPEELADKVNHAIEKFIEAKDLGGVPQPKPVIDPPTLDFQSTGTGKGNILLTNNASKPITNVSLKLLNDEGKAFTGFWMDTPVTSIPKGGTHKYGSQTAASDGTQFEAAITYTLDGVEQVAEQSFSMM